MADIGIKLTAQDNTKSAFDSVGRNLANIQTSAASVAGALAGIGIGISVGGFVAMTRAIVDGLDAMNDLKDATGASIENISALEDVARRSGASFDTVSTALVKLNQGLNAAKPGSETENAIKAIGLSVKDLKALDPAEAFQKVAVALSGFADDANKARLTQELFGKSLKEVAPLLKDLAESGQLNATVTTAQAEEAEKLNKEFFNLSKNATDLGRALVKDLVPSLNNLALEMAAIKKTSNGFFDGFLTQLSQNPFKTAGENAAKYRKEIDSLELSRIRLTKAGNSTAGIDEEIATLRRRQAYFREVELQTTRFNDADNTDAVARRFTRDRPTLNLPDQSAAKEAAAAAKALAEQNRELEKEKALLATLSGFSADYEEQLGRLGRIREKGNISLTEYVQLVTELNAKQPAIKANLDAEAKAMAAIEKANMAALESRLKYVASLGTGLEKLQQETTSQQEYIDRLGLSKEAVAELDAAKLESQAVILDLIAIKELDKNLDEEQFELYKKQSAELRKQAALKVQGSIKESQLEIEKEITAERKRGWEETDRIARDVFTNWATDGGNAAQKIGDTLKKALLSAVYEATLKPLVMQVYASVAGAGGGGSIAGTALQAATGGSGGGASGLLGLAGSAGGLFGSGFNAGLGAVFGEAGTLGGLSAGTTALGAGNIAGGLGTLAGVAAPYIAGLTLLKSLTDYSVESRGNGLTATLGGATGLPSGSVGMYNEFSQSSSGILSGGNTINRDWSVADQGVADYIAGSVQRITASNRAYADALGLSSESINSFTKNIEVSLTGLDAAGQQAAIDAALSTFAAEQAAATYGDALTSVARDGETTTQTLQRLGAELSGTNAMFADLGYSLFDVSVAGASAASTLVAAFGDLQTAQAQLGSFYQNFYSQDEQQANTYRTVQADLATAGINLTTEQLRSATRADIRAAVDGLAGNTSTEQGAAQYAAAVRAANTLASVKPVETVAQQAAPTVAPLPGATQSGGIPYVDATDTALTAWEEATAAIVDAMRDLRVTLLDSGPDSFAKLQAQFVIETASAKAGNVAAAQELPELVRSLSAASKDQFTSGVQRDLFIARLIQSLGEVAGVGGAGANLSIPRFAAGGYHRGGWAIVGEEGPELVNMPSARVFNANDTRSMLGGGTDPAVLEELRALRAAMDGIRASNNSIAASSSKTAQVLDTASKGGQPIGTKVIT